MNNREVGIVTAIAYFICGCYLQVDVAKSRDTSPHSTLPSAFLITIIYEQCINPFNINMFFGGKTRQKKYPSFKNM